MSDDLNTAGQVLSGKEADRKSDDLRLAARQSKLSRKKDLTTGAVVADGADTKCDDNETQDEFFTDALARFGIQI